MRANWFSSALERRNFCMLTVDGALYNVALTCLDATILIPLFLKHVGGSTTLIGLAAAIRQLSFVLPQWYIARRLPRIPRLSRFVFWAYLLCRFAFLAIIAVLLQDASSSWVIVAFFVGYTMFALGEGLTQVPWMEVFGQTITPPNQGRLFGLMQTLGGVGAFLCGFVIQHILAYPERYPYPHNFIIIFSLAFAILLISTLSFIYVKEDPSRRGAVKKTERLRSTELRGRRIWRTNHAFRHLLIVQLLVGLHQIATPFYILYVQQLPGTSAPLIGELVLAQIAGSILGGMVFGLMSSRQGNRRTIKLTVLLNITVPVLILVAGSVTGGEGVQFLVCAAFFLLGLVGGGWIGFTNYLLEIANEHTRGRLVALINICSAPLTILPVFSGRFASVLSYPVIFEIVLILLLVAFWWSFRLPATTRHRRGDRVVRSDRQTNAAPQ
jgi:MFS family permease